MATIISTKRFELCLSPHDLADIVGLPVLDLCDIEKGAKQTSPEVQARIGKALQEEVKVLFDDDGFANFAEN